MTGEMTTDEYPPFTEDEKDICNEIQSSFAWAATASNGEGGTQVVWMKSKINGEIVYVAGIMEDETMYRPLFVAVTSTVISVLQPPKGTTVVARETQETDDSTPQED